MTEAKTKKLDFKKECRFLFSPSAKKPEIVDVPPFKYIMIDGQGHPSKAEDFQEKIQVLYGLSYTLKFMLKADTGDPFDYTVGPLSGLWHAEDMKAFMEQGREGEWEWTLMIMQPDRVTKTLFEKAKIELARKKNPPFIQKAYLDLYKEGLAAQIMHIGPYSDEGPTIQKLHTFFQEEGYTFNGRHHEVYMSDPRRCSLDKLRTIIRQPIKKSGASTRLGHHTNILRAED